MQQLDLFDSFQANFEYAQQKLSEANTLYIAAKKLRDDNCKHPKIVKKESYFEGSYYDKAYTDHWNECEICGAKSEVRHESHSWYG